MPDTAQPTTKDDRIRSSFPLGDWKTSQANARRCITDEHQVRVRLENGACLWTTYDQEEPDVVCIDTQWVPGPDGRRDLICVEYDEFTIAGAALLEQRDTILAQRDD